MRLRALSNRTFAARCIDVGCAAAEEAFDLGIVDALGAAGDALTLAVEMALEDAKGAPLPRHAINDWFARSIHEALEFEQTIQPALLNSEDAAEGRAAFREKRRAQFWGR